MVTGYRVPLGGGFDKVVKFTNGADFIKGKRLDRKIASNYKNDGRVEIVRKKPVCKLDSGRRFDQCNREILTLL